MIEKVLNICMEGNYAKEINGGCIAGNVRGCGYLCVQQ